MDSLKADVLQNFNIQFCINGFMSIKKAHFAMSGLFDIWLSNLGSNQGPAD